MAEKALIAHSLIASMVSVICHAHSGYRRAGMAFNHGENTIEPNCITATQLAQLNADPRLKVSVDTDGKQISQAEGDLSKATLSQPTDSDQTDGDLGDSALPANLVDAIKLLDPSNSDHFTSTGKPQVDVLAELMQAKVTAAERDEAWEIVQESGFCVDSEE